MFEEARRREHEIGVVGGIGLEQVDDHRQEVLAPQRLAQALLFRARSGDVDVPTEKALRRRGVLETPHEVHLADHRRVVARELAAAQVVTVEPAGLDPVQVEETPTRACEIAGERRQQSHRAHDVAAHGLALKSLADPEKRRTLPIGVGGSFDLAPGDARRLLGPCRRAALDRGADFLESRRVGIDELLVQQPVAPQHVHEREGEGGVGARSRLQVQVGRRAPSRSATGRRRSPSRELPVASARAGGARTPTGWRPRRGSSWPPERREDRILRARSRRGTRARRARLCCRPSPDRPRSPRAG